MSDGKLRHIGSHSVTETKALSQWESPRPGMKDGISDLMQLSPKKRKHLATVIQSYDVEHLYLDKQFQTS